MLKKFDFLYFDVADTLLYKRGLYAVLQKSLSKFGFRFRIRQILEKHRLISEIIAKPEKTSRSFYDYFNGEFLYSLGILPKSEILREIYKKCKTLDWVKYNDSNVLGRYAGRIGIISNWDNSLRAKLTNVFGFDFEKIIISSEVNIMKPDPRIYMKAIHECGFPKKRIAYIGDSLKLDILPAKRLGLEAILLDRENLYPNYQGGKLKTLIGIDKLLR